MTQPEPTIVLDLIEAFRRSKTMFAALALGVFDRLAGTPKTALALALEIETHADTTERLLDACVSLGLLSKSDGHFVNTPCADAYLASGSSTTFAGYAQ